MAARKIWQQLAVANRPAVCVVLARVEHLSSPVQMLPMLQMPYIH